MELDFNELRDLLAAINQTDIAEFTLKSGEFELVMRKGAQGVAPGPKAEVVAAAPPSAPLPVAAPSAPPPAPTPPPRAEKLLDVISPMVGTFYRAPAPDEPPFVDTGDRIRPGQTVCIIEAMKLMNEIESEVTGEIIEILVQNSQPVEYGQVLMRVKPS